MATWPTSLPAKPKSGSLVIAPEPNVAEFQADAGRPQRSRRYTLTRMLYDAQMDLTEDQVGDLLAFFANDCVSGVDSFLMPDWLGGQTKRFTWRAPPQPQHIAGEDWIVALSLAREN